MVELIMKIWKDVGRSGAKILEEVDILSVSEKQLFSTSKEARSRSTSRRERAHKRSIRAKQKFSRKKNRPR